ncbi:unnamed protein product [Mesocestoides corti]|uniref:Sema domain-containing protein n=1 Tax=Mesocestoides corti TaxID=53468 RepID=A0A0R3UNT1_MESCO|nr:unnamed protein product [Mesocestoides corti]
MVIVKRDLNEASPLLILRRGYPQANRQPSANPNWWQVQLFSRNFQLTHSSGRQDWLNLAHQRFHGNHHLLFFNREHTFTNPLDAFLTPPRIHLKAQSAMAMRFCLNDAGFQMPDNGLFVFTTLVKVKLSCSVRIASSGHTRDDEVTFDHIVLSSSFVTRDGDLFYVGLFSQTGSQASMKRLFQSKGLLTAPLAVCVFRDSDLTGLLTRHQTVAVHLTSRPVEVNHTVAGQGASRFVLLNDSAHLNYVQCRNVEKRADDLRAAIKGVYLPTPWTPMDGEPLSYLQTKQRFVAMLVDTPDGIPGVSRRQLTSSRDVCIVYLLTATGKLALMISQRDVNKGNTDERTFEDGFYADGLRPLFSLQLTPAFVPSQVGMEFSTATSALQANSRFASASYLYVEKDFDFHNTEIFRWRTVDIECHALQESPLSNASSTSLHAVPLSTQHPQYLSIIVVLSVMAACFLLACVCLASMVLRARRIRKQRPPIGQFVVDDLDSTFRRNLLGCHDVIALSQAVDVAEGRGGCGQPSKHRHPSLSRGPSEPGKVIGFASVPLTIDTVTGQSPQLNNDIDFDVFTLAESAIVHHNLTDVR